MRLQEPPVEPPELSQQFSGEETYLPPSVEAALYSASI